MRSMMMINNPLILALPPNRVRRNYQGGLNLDRIAGKTNTSDGDRPEDWLCSLTAAINPGMTYEANEGQSGVFINGRLMLLRELIERDPVHYLGKRHSEKYGVQMGFLAKLLDSSMRLHMQAHPTREYANKELRKPWGKVECYLILSVRPGIEPYIYLGFQKPPTVQEWHRIVTDQDMPAMLACFEKVPVQPGEAWYVPGGYPHALGEGLTLLEVMEPSDLVVRCEFERNGIIVPPSARFMGLDPSEALQIFNYSQNSVKDIQRQFRIPAETLTVSGELTEFVRIGPEQIDCFEVREIWVGRRSEYFLGERFAVAIVVEGEGEINCGQDNLLVRKGSCCFLTATSNRVQFGPRGSERLKILLCLPGRNDDYEVPQAYSGTRD
jgi:mannose-6-phosphate isomerase